MRTLATALMALAVAGFVLAATPALADGASLYAENCAHCHGAEGERPMGASMKTIAGVPADELEVKMAATPIHNAILAKLSDEDLLLIAATVAGLGR